MNDHHPTLDPDYYSTETVRTMWRTPDGKTHVVTGERRSIILVVNALGASGIDEIWIEDMDCLPEHRVPPLCSLTPRNSRRKRHA